MSKPPVANRKRPAPASDMASEFAALRRRAAALADDLRATPLDVMPGAAARLESSVLRPLDDALAAFGHKTASAAPAPARPSRRGARRPGADESVFELAKDATRLCARPDAPALLTEATAGLQDIACRLASAAGAETLNALIEELRLLQADAKAGVQVSVDGPYLVTRPATLTNHLGETQATWPQMALCRCGGSAIKPLCDGTHAATGFSGAKGPDRVADRRDTYHGQQVTIFDNRGICAHSGFCTDRLAGVFHTAGDPFVTPSGGRMDEIMRAVRDCPSGALGLALAERETRSYVDRKDRPRAIEVTKNGPYRLVGGIALVDDAGNDVSRARGASREHYSLCRCGQSQNKPFCSGRHWYVGFSDPPAPDKPTLFDWAGGLPSLTRLTRRFLETHVPDDELLSGLFADMAPDLAERMAAWLGDAFGGPPFYSENYGDADDVLPGLAGHRLTEAQRARWVAGLQRSAEDVNLAPEPEFRAAFTSYLEWASRSALTEAQVTARTSAPRWDWTPAGRPQLCAETHPSDTAVDLPAPGNPIFFEEHIRPLFRDSDRDAMKWAFDLSSYPDVTTNAGAILQRLRAGTMPCDGAWSADKIDAFQRWVDAGTPQSASQTSPRPQASDAGAPESIGGRLGSLVKLRTDGGPGEHPLIIEHREPLIYMLCSAAELEHALMCEYLFAAFSLKRSIDEGLTAEQLAAVERWRSAILMVAKQEMLHLAINCNLVNSLGASPHLSRPNLPQPARHYPSGVRLTLLPFNEQTLRHFLYLERPEGMAFDDAVGLAAVNGAAPVMGPEEIAPHLQEFATVGHLYRSIEAGFRHLADKMGEDKLFVTPASSQATGDLFGWPQLEPITSVAGVVRAIETIVEQGEGPRGDWRNAHFGRFLAILDEYLAMMKADPGLEVARPVLPALVRPPESGETADLITDPLTAAIADLGNVAYEVLLQLLYRLLSRVDENNAQIKTLADVGVGLMFDVIEPLGDILTTLPVGPEHPGRTTGPSFELFYQPDYLLPHREAAWRLMSEHLTDAAVLTEAQAAHEPRLVPVAQALRRHADSLASP